MKMASLMIDKIKSKTLLAAFSCLITAFVLLSFSSQNAYAESKQCRALRAQLNSLKVLRASSSNKSTAFKRFDSLSRRQAAALKNARRDAVSLNCITSSGKRTGKGAAFCPALLKKIGQMNSNLKKLNRKRDKEKPKNTRTASDIRKQKRVLRAKIRKLRCGSDERVASNEETTKRKYRTRTTNLLERLFGTPKRIERLFGTPKRIRRESEDRLRSERIIRLQEQARKQRSYGNVFRTLCVRVCDGYYFPVNFATVRQSFEADKAFCKASNPNTEMRLFFHRNPSETSEDMIDLAGRQYIDLPNAFRYRREIVDNHSCPRSPIKSAFTQVAGSALDKATALAKRSANAQLNSQNGNSLSSLTLPAPKPNIFADADTHLAQIGKFELKPVLENKQPVDTNIVRTYDPSKNAANGIRVIGSTFLDDQQSVELLLAPDQTQVQ